MIFRNLIPPIVAGLALSWTGLAAAAAAGPQTHSEGRPASDAAAPSPVADNELDALAGGTLGDTQTNIAVTDQELTAVNTGNRIQANNVGSGAISLEGGALSQFSGLGNFVMNTGHNNNLQSSLSVTVIVTP